MVTYIEMAYICYIWSGGIYLIGPTFEVVAYIWNGLHLKWWHTFEMAYILNKVNSLWAGHFRGNYLFSVEVVFNFHEDPSEYPIFSEGGLSNLYSWLILGLKSSYDTDLDFTSSERMWWSNLCKAGALEWKWWTMDKFLPLAIFWAKTSICSDYVVWNWPMWKWKDDIGIFLMKPCLDYQWNLKFQLVILYFPALSWTEGSSREWRIWRRGGWGLGRRREGRVTCIGLPPHHLARAALQPATGPTYHFAKKSLSSLSPALVCLSQQCQEFLQNSQTPAPSMPSHLLTSIFLLRDPSSALHIAYLSDVTNCICQIVEYNNFDGTKRPSTFISPPQKCTANGWENCGRNENFLGRAKTLPGLGWPGCNWKNLINLVEWRESDAIHMYVGLYKFLVTRISPRSFCSCHHDELSGTRQRRGRKEDKKAGNSGHSGKCVDTCRTADSLSSRHRQTKDVRQDESY